MKSAAAPETTRTRSLPTAFVNLRKVFSEPYWTGVPSVVEVNDVDEAETGTQCLMSATLESEPEPASML